MKISESKEEFNIFLPHKSLIMLRGNIMLGLGAISILMSFLASDVEIMSLQNGWLPVIAFVILLTGLIEIFDVFLSLHTNRFISNLQFALLDTIVGGLLFFSMEYPAKHTALLIAAFLLFKGCFRAISAFVGHFTNSKYAMIGGGISVILGLTIWMLWPGNVSSTLLSVFLSIEVALRGWAVKKFAEWLEQLEADE